MKIQVIVFEKLFPQNSGSDCGVTKVIKVCIHFFMSHLEMC